jgi:hypothetical protein
MLKKIILAAVVVLLIIGISSFTANAGEKKDVKAQKEAQLCQEVSKMINDGTINKYEPKKIKMPINIDPHGFEYPNLDIDGDGASDKVTITSGSYDDSILEIQLSSGGGYELDESSGTIMLSRLKDQIYALMTYWEWDKRQGSSKKGKIIGHQLYKLTKSKAELVCDEKDLIIKFESEAEKLEFIREVLSKEKNLRIADDALYTHSQYCSVMMKDFLAGKNFKAIEPDVVADSVDDPRLAKWNQNQCFDKQPEDFGLEQQQFYDGLQFLGNPPYRYYNIELDGNIKNGTEDMICYESGCVWADLKKCEIKNGFPATSAKSNISKKLNAVYLNTPVYYKARLWMVDFVDGFDLHLYTWVDKNKIDICLWFLSNNK